MILTFIARDEKVPIIFTFVTTTYNGGRSGGGSTLHELIATNTPPYEQTSKP